MLTKAGGSAGDALVACNGVRKRYGRAETYTDALLGVDLQIRPGEIVGVLGPNGAGKTTLVEILEGIRTPDAGTISVLGVSPSDAEAIKLQRHRMGVSAQNTVLPPLLTIRELLELHHTLFPHARKVDELIDVLGLSEKCDTRVKNLSGGQQQRVAVALALIGDPELLFLDEPTSQLDPAARRAVWEVLERQRERRNAAILITTHQMEEAQRICDRVVVLDHGRILAEGSPTALVDRHCPERIVEFVSHAHSDFAFLNGNHTRLPVGASSIRVRVRTSNANGTIADLMKRHGDGQLRVEDIRVDRQSLEDVFLTLTGRRIRN